MGSDPNTYPQSPPERKIDPVIALTLGEMVARHWSIRAVCENCQSIMWCDPRHLVASVGADTFFWGRRGRCRMMTGLNRCSGKVSFQAKPVRAEAWYSLDEPMMKARHLWKVRNAKAPTS